ncbi:WW domain-binding protein 11-like isoform X2 [Saccostrea cucullata]|uniref:WW domain-binding protein 11-like isoform X2 n=1 Tax=Saccostrea cuccullata TaxID=36930 RepID=UPI002ED08929
MGRRSINTTKSGKFMNPTDQARKEARKKELKKNKKQRMMVRTAVLKGKDPLKLLQEMEVIDLMEFNPIDAPKLSEKVLKDKRKKLKETFQRVLKLYEKENPELAKDLQKQEVEYDRKREKLQVYYEQVKNAERVKLDQIPLPALPQHDTTTSMIPLPGDIPLPMSQDKPHGILKKTTYEKSLSNFDLEAARRRPPPGPPPGPPPILSDSEDEEEYDPAKGIEENIGTVDVDVEHPHDVTEHPMETDHSSGSKQKKIRFIDDDSRNPEEEEKDTRLKYARPKAAGVTPLQAKMLKLAGQQAPTKEKKERRRDSDKSDSDDEKTEKSQEVTSRLTEGTPVEGTDTQQAGRLVPPGPPPGAPPGVPPGVPPGPPPGVPPMMFRPPPLRSGPPGAPPRMLPPGPPPGRPQGLPPGPPPGLPPNLQLPGQRMPPAPPGVPPPRIMRPPSGPPGVLPPGLPPPPGVGPNPNVLSAPPSIMKPPRKSGEEEKKNMATIEAKPQIKNLMGDVTRFMPTALKVKREGKDSKGRIRTHTKEEERRPLSMSQMAAPAVTTAPTKTKDDAYDQFMKEMSDLL